MQTPWCPVPRMGPGKFDAAHGRGGFKIPSNPTRLRLRDHRCHKQATRCPQKRGPKAGRAPAASPPQHRAQLWAQHSRRRFGGSPVEFILELPLSLGECGAGDAFLAEVQLGVLLDVVTHDLL